VVEAGLVAAAVGAGLVPPAVGTAVVATTGAVVGAAVAVGAQPTRLIASIETTSTPKKSFFITSSPKNFFNFEP
jgi:uncharacterized membrane protein